MLKTLTTDDGSLTLYSGRYGQAYASRRGALTESRAVFLDGSGVAARLAAGDGVRVLEVGFGTGLNFFLTAHTYWQHRRTQPGARLYYTALEHELLTAEELADLGYGALLGCETLFSRYLAWRAALAFGAGAPTGTQRLILPGVTLELHLGDAALQASPGALPKDTLPKDTLPKDHFHAVYQDAFSPDANPELWSEAFLGVLVAALRPGGTLVSYCVKGEVRRRLERLGMKVFRRPGPEGGKREVLLACKPTPAAVQERE